MRYLTLEGLGRLLRPFKVRLSNMLTRGVVQRVDDAPGVQEVQAELLADEVRDELEHLQFFGFASHPLPGAECLVAFPGGDRSTGFVVATSDRRYRVKVARGEVAVYDATGSSIRLKASGDIELAPSTGVIALAGQAHQVARGDELNVAIANLGTAIAAALTAMGASPSTPMPGALAVAAGASVTTAVSAFNTAAAAALSNEVKLA